MMKSKILNFFGISIIVLSLVACSSGTTKKDADNESEETKKELNTNSEIADLDSDNTMGEIDKQTAVVIKSVICKNNTTHSYALYLPSNYSPGKKWPVIYAFDSHAHGNLPVERYKDLAEEYGYILIGSNNSKNGQSSAMMRSIVDVLFKETYNRYSIDDKRIYLTGFSGGARVANMIAIFKGGIRGVIACGGGFPKIDKPIQSRFDFIGLVGNEDFNYLEMKKLDRDLSRTGFRHHLILFDGKHEWPPAEIVKDAFIWLEVNAMKDNLIPVNENSISTFKDIKEKHITKYQRSGNLTEAYDVSNMVINFLDGLSDVSSNKEKLNELTNSSSYQKLYKQNEQLELSEAQTQPEYINAFSSSDYIKIKDEIGSLKKIISSSKIPGQVLSAKRLLNYISLMSFLYSDKYLKSNDLQSAASLLEIYKSADAENPDVYYLYACYFVKQKNFDEAFKQLKNAVKKGFDDPERIKTDKTFDPVRNSDEFIAILESLMD